MSKRQASMRPAPDRLRALAASLAPVLPFLVGVGGTFLSLLLWRSLHASELQNVRAAFELEAAQHVARLQRERVVALESLQSVAALFDSSERVEPEEFRTFTTSSLERNEALRALAWIERVDGADGAFDRVAFSQGPEQASLAPGSLPDLDPRLAETLTRATERGRIALSGPVVPPGSEHARVFAALAVRHGSGRLSGRVALLLDVERLLPPVSRDVALRVEDVTDGGVVLAGPSQEIAPSADEDALSYTPGVEELGGRLWRITSSAAPGFVTSRTTAWPLWVLLLGLAVTAAVVAVQLTATSRKRIQALVERRTSEVVDSYATLASEAEERRMATREAHESQQQLRDILDLVPSQIYVKDRYGRMVMANRATAEAYGTTVDELTGPATVDYNADVRDPGPELAEDRRLMGGSKSVIVPAQPFVDAEGRRRLLRVAKIPCRVSGEKALLYVRTDVTERQQAEAVVRSQNRLLAELAQGLPPEEVLLHVIETAEEIVPGLRCSVLFLAPDRQHLVRGLAPRLPEEYSQAIDGLRIGPDAGSCGAAAHLGQRFIVEDVRRHPNWALYRDLAEQADIRASWSEPIRASDGEILGTFAMYYSEPRKPEPYEERFIESMAHLAGIAIERGHLGARA